MEFEWDERKRERNLAKHGIDFVRAQLLFDGRAVITASAFAGGERRYATVGKIDGRFYTVIWTRRREAIRIISARRARYVERAQYEAIYG